MIAGNREKVIGGTAYRHDPLYAFGNIIIVSQYVNFCKNFFDKTCAKSSVLVDNS